MTSDPRNEGAFDPYTAPVAHVADTSSGRSEPVFFAVGLLKLVLMSVVCLGFYQLYWFYRNWRAADGPNSTAFGGFIQALFYPVLAYFLFRRIEVERRKQGVGRPLAPGPLAAALFVLTVLWRLPDPYWLVAIFAFAPIVPVQGAVNALNQKLAPDADETRRLGPWNVLALLAGGLVLAMMLVGLTLGGD
jgi:hypothetical protein